MSELTPQTTEIETIKQVAREIATDLREHPERWFQGALTRFPDGTTSSSGVRVSDGVCWCLEGHIFKRVASEVRHQVLWAFRDRADNLQLLGDFGSLFSWNDAYNRTVEDVISLCEGVAES